MVGKRGWWLLTVLFVLGLAAILHSGEAAACITTADCPQGHTCDESGVCVGDVAPCEFTCPPPSESPCNQPIQPSAACGTCSGYGTACIGTDACYPTPYNCCTPSSCSVSASSTLCGMTALGTRGCGVSCSVTGSNCTGVSPTAVCVQSGSSYSCKEPCTGESDIRCASSTAYNACVGGYRSTTATSCPSSMTCASNNCVYTPSISANADVSGTAPSQIVTITITTYGEGTGVSVTRTKDGASTSVSVACTTTNDFTIKPTAANKRTTCTGTDNGLASGTYTYSVSATINGATKTGTATATVGSCDQCTAGQKKCASGGTSYYTCTTNPQGCRVWTSTTTTCGTADCTSYTCTPGETFTASCTSQSKPDGSPCSTGACIGGECKPVGFTNIENAYSITAGTSYTFTPIPSVSGASFSTTGGLASVPYFTTSFIVVTNIAQVTTTAYQQIIKMFINANEVANKTFNIVVTCNQDDACYCPIGMKTGCGNLNQNSTAMQTRYCPNQKTCVNCDGTTVFNPALLKCTQCNATIITNCPQGSDCQITVCTTGGSCGFSNKNRGITCNGGAGTCDGQGNCNGCDPIICANRNSSTLINESSEVNGCKNLTQQRNTTSLYACAGTNCAVTNTRTEYNTITTYLQNGAQCVENDKTGTCANNVCVPYGCQNDGDCIDASGCQIGACNANTHQCTYENNPNACNSVKWNEQPSCAANAFICGGAIECTRNVIDTTCTAANITAGLCKPADTGYKCVASCPRGSDIPGCAVRSQTNYTNANMLPSMYSCSGTSSCYLCEENHVYYKDDDKCYPAEYTMSFTANNAIATEQTTVTPVLKDGSGAIIKNRDHSFQFRLTTANKQLYSYDTFSFSMERPGVYPTTITALRNNVPVASKTDDLAITCSPGPCCESGATTSKPDGAACQEQVQSGVFVSGRCKAAVCVLACTLQSAKETGKDGNGKDRCNNGIDDDCDGKYDCNDPDCSSTGVCTTTCPAGQLICGGSCTDTTTDNTHCGDCNRPCKPSEQCTQGACIAIEDCSIVCNKDRDCRSGEVCINPGDCSRSYCAPADAVIANETTIANIVRTIAESKTYSITKEIVGNRIIIRMKNLAPVPLQNVTMTVNINFPKEMVASASDIGADLPFSVIEDDPVIAFDIAEIKDYRTITIELPNTIDPAMEQSVYVSAVHNTITGTADALDDKQLTITSKILKEDGKTKLLIGLDPHAKLTGVRIPVEIPKCVAQSAKELDLDGDYDIIQDDPLIVWTFDSLSAKQNIEIGMGDHEMAEDCEDGITAFAVAAGVDRPLNPWLPLLAIPILGIIIIFFQRFRADDVEERIGKEEFERLARDQGKSEEEIREAWDTYQRKF